MFPSVFPTQNIQLVRLTFGTIQSYDLHLYVWLRPNNRKHANRKIERSQQENTSYLYLETFNLMICMFCLSLLFLQDCKNELLILTMNVLHYNNHHKENDVLYNQDNILF